MRTQIRTALLTVGLVLLLTGCGEQTAGTSSPAASPAAAAAAPVTVAHPQDSVKVGDKAVCVICNAKEGATEPEEVKATLNYNGKTYAFCSEEEKAEFISSPAKYAQAQ